VINEIGEPRGLLRSIKERWRLIGHTLRYKEELYPRILKRKIKGKRGLLSCPFFTPQNNNNQ